MANNWLTIPCAPNYEIDSRLRCRVKKTGQLLKLQVIPHRRSYYSLRDKSHPYTIKRAPKTLRAQALEAVNPQLTFKPIPSLGCRYEINIHGKIRNAQTKIVIKQKKYTANLRDNDGKYISACVKSLLWEVHGKEHHPRFRPCPCIASTANFKRRFPNLRECARFIAPRVHYAVDTVTGRLCKREPNVYGYDITYLPQVDYLPNSKNACKEPA